MGNTAVPANYVPILLFIGIAIAFGAVSLLAGWFVRPSRPYRAKLAPYESGSPLFQDARVQFPMRYYIIAMLFIIFDIETVFMIPWGAHFRELSCLEPLANGVCPPGQASFFGLVEMLIFILILAVGFVYVWKKGALQWD